MTIHKQPGAERRHVWPASPYKSLNSYGQEDAPLFVGRDAEILECANRLGQFSTRILMIQGPTGCGKTSFLRAGLIPYLEDEAIGFQFPRARHVEQGKALFVRATDRPLYKLAEAIYDLIQNVEELADLRDEWLSTYLVTADRAEFKAALLEVLSASPAGMVDILMSIARRLPKTLVLIIDQAEEVLTLDAGPEGDAAREHFFKFLQLFSRVRCDLKLVITLRTDFYGRFENQLEKEAQWVDMEEPLGREAIAAEERFSHKGSIRVYFLNPLPSIQLVRVIELPTFRQLVGNYGAPYEHYRFSYADTLPDRIILDIEQALQAGRLAGGTLPVLQMVCDRLYQTTKMKATAGAYWEITEDDYHQLGSVEDLLSAHLRQVVEGLCREYYSRLSSAAGLDDLEVKAEAERWLKVLSYLIHVHPDNAVTKQSCRKQELEQRADKLECKIEFDWLSSRLMDESVRVLSSMPVPVPGESRKIICYTLGHDSIALALQRWMAAAAPDEEPLPEWHGESLLEIVIVTARRLDEIKDRRQWVREVERVATFHAGKFRVTAERIKELADKILHTSSFRPSHEELQVLATQPECYYPLVLQRGTKGPILRLTRFDEAASNIEEEGGNAGMLAKSIKAKAMTAKA